jgi:hypothetical protein
MKFKDYFSKLKEQGKIANEEYDKFLESVPDGELPDALFTILQDKFLTIDRAATHKDVYGKIKRENLDPIDNDLKKLLTFIDGVDKHKAVEISGLNSTYDKLAAITASFPQIIDKVKQTPGGDEEAKKQLEELKKINKELTDRIGNLNTEFSTKEKNLLKQFSEKEHDMKLEWELQNKARSFTLAEAHETLRDPITRVILTDLRNENILKLGEKPGEVLVYEDANGTLRPKFNGNDPVVIDKLLEAKFAPYIKKSNADDGDGKQQRNPQVKTFPVTTDNKPVRQGRSTTVQ